MRRTVTTEGALRTLVFGLALAVAFALPARAQDESIPCIPETGATMLLSYGDVVNDAGVNCRITPAGDLDLYQFAGSAGELVRLTATDPNGSYYNAVRVEMLDPMGEPVVVFATSGASNGSSGALRDIVLPKTGLYTILVSENGNNETINYQLGLKRLVPHGGAPIAYGQILVQEINPAADVDQFVFNGSSGDLMRIIGTDTGGSYYNALKVELLDPSGTVIGSFATSGSSNSANANSMDVTLTTTGLYSIVTTENGNNEGIGYNVSLQCILGACLTAPTTCLIDLSLDGSTLNMDFVLANLAPSTFDMYLYANVGNIQLLHTALPALAQPTNAALSIPNFPNLGTVALWVGMTSASGVQCFHFDTIDSSAVEGVFSSRTSSSITSTSSAEEIEKQLKKNIRWQPAPGQGKAKRPK